MNTLPIRLLIQLEVIWWIVTLVIIGAVLFPIRGVLDQYVFLLSNVIFIVITITLARYIFLLPFTFLAPRQNLKVILVFLCIPLVFFLVQELNNFQTFLDYNGAGAVLGDASLDMSDGIMRYTYNEMLLFAVGSIVSGVVFPFRLLLSVWRGRNRGTV